MEILACAHCGAALTGPVTRVRFPPYANHPVGNGHPMPVLMDAGTYAVDPEPSGGPWRPWADLAEGEAEARGYYAPVAGVRDGRVGRLLCAPGDATGTVLVPERADGTCCGITGDNLSCASCLRPVGGRDDGCSIWQAARFDPRAVRTVPAGPDRPPADWTELVHDRSGPLPVSERGRWNERCTQETTLALAHLIAAADGHPVRIEHGHATALLGPELARRLGTATATGPAKRCALHGPDLPLVGPRPDLALVPLHPQTGEVWPAPPGVRAVPLHVEVWRHLAFHDERPAVRAGRLLRAELARDDPQPLHRGYWLWVDHRLMRDVLARHPAVRRPGVRAVYDVLLRGYDH
ncbi:hypothetical protein [Kitasatospora phosalacinea]|uniref:Uncharacterized protein n=1 Tax=Kitasatospora phosalacinea TaxID=2065 RepID=A0A9W6PHA4_9ACTN|nr:hypothetical protein [Kitasatospora phosalacinea]GLW54842.1 hypothetical protein Kpho01_28530 [Kitasatospora phosalacinea]